MKVKELITHLQGIDPERIVVMSIDPEGNGFSPLHDVDDFSRYSESCGEVGIAELTPKLESQGYTREDVPSGPRAVVLWPR